MDRPTETEAMRIDWLLNYMKGGPTSSTAKTWTYTPPECFCEDPDEEINPWCWLAGFHGERPETFTIEWDDEVPA